MFGKKMKAMAFAALVMAVAVLPFARSGRYGLVNCDDYEYAACPMVTAGMSAQGLAKAMTYAQEGIWMPLTWASYMLDYDLAKALGRDMGKFGDDVYHVMHVHSVLVHGVNAALLFVLLLCLAGRRNALFAALCALVWAVHPLRCESVDWVASRKDVLSMAWLLLSLVCWVRWRKGRTVASKALLYAASAMACAIGGMAKPSVMCYPALVVLLDWFFLRRDVRSRKAVLLMAAGYALPVALAAAIGGLAYVMQDAGGCTVEFGDMPFFARLLNAAVSFGVYVLHTAVPVGLAPQCIMRWPNAPRLMGPGLVTLGVFGWWMWRHVTPEWRRLQAAVAGSADKGEEGDVRVSKIVAGGLWYAVAIVPFLGIFGFGYHALADRFTYIPAVGVSVALLAAVCPLCGKRRMLAVGMLTAAVAGLSALAGRQTRVWQDDETMWTQTIAVDGVRNGVATAGLGLWHYEHTHDLGKAIACFDTAFATSPVFLQKTCFLHVDAVAESGDLDKAYKLLRWISEFSRKCREREAGGGGLAGFDGRKPIPQYRFARIACLLRDEKCRKAAQRELDELRQDMPESIHVAYFDVRAALLEGDRAGAECAWNRLLSLAERKDGCLRYRFLERLLQKTDLP